jgi:aldose sugar dehydrogenase
MKNIKLPFYLLLIVFLYACGEKTEVIDLSEHYFKKPIQLSNTENTEKQSFMIDTLVTGLKNPWSLAFMPNGDMLIAERDGEIRIVRNGIMLESTINGLPEIYVKGQGGLLELQLHPNYEENGWIYLAYSAPMEDGGNTAIMRARLDGFQLVDQEVLFQATPYPDGRVHFGCRIRFDDDGYMFFSVGERGRMQNAQDLSNHSGKVHRLYDDGRIPEDNPFVNNPDAMPSIFTYGNRNPQGMDIHPVTREIWTHEHGPKGGDEINIIRSGLNFGWPEITYGINYNGEIISEFTEKEGMEQPLHYWDPSIAPCGMAFVTSDKYPNWKNNLLVGSLSFQYVARCEIDEANEKVLHEEKLLEGIGRVRTVQQGPDGYLYVATESPGLVVRLYPVE